MKVSIIIGEICSGKTTYSSSFSEDCRIDVGFIVRSLTSIEERTFDQNLDKDIIEALLQEIDLNNVTGEPAIAIVGIRQVSILEAIMHHCEEIGVDCEIIYLEVPVEIRKQRYEARRAAKDVSIEFDFADKQDKELGLYALIQYIKHRKETKIIQNY